MNIPIKSKNEDCCGADDKKTLAKQQIIHRDDEGHIHGSEEPAAWKRQNKTIQRY